MRLRKIEITDFGGFPQHEVIELGKEGKNLLVYGENGSGKSTVFNAVDRFFDRSLNNTDIKRFRNLFLKVADSDTTVKMVFGPLVGGEVQDIPANTFEWTDGSIPTGVAAIRSTAQLPSRLDYRAVLSTHFIHRSSKDVDLYDLVVSSMLAGLVNARSTDTFGEERVKIDESMKQLSIEPPGYIRDALVVDLDNRLQSHSDGLRQLCTTIQTDVRRLLKYFKDGQSVKFRVVAGSYDDGAGKLTLPRILLSSRLHSREIPSHHQVINEARLTSIGLCIYLAAINHQGTTLDSLGTAYLKLLVLDDVLIGLDMANRFPVLEILRKEFIDWQIILLTHDFNWFEIVRLGLDANRWSIYEMYRSVDPEKGFERPVVRAQEGGWEGLIAVSERFRVQHDYRASAVYARAGFETWLRKKSDKIGGVMVPYSLNPAYLTSRALWQGLVARFGILTPDQATAKSNLELSTKIFLNAWSHSGGNAITAGEVQSAISSVKDVGDKFKKP